MIAPRSNARIDALLGARIAAGDFPAAVYMVSENGRALLGGALGDAVRQPVHRAARLETIFDLASLTKPLVTALLCAILLERKLLLPDAPAAVFLPEFDRPRIDRITLRHLIAHTSGLPAWRPLYLLAGRRERTLSCIAKLPLETEPGTHVKYSDLGFITLGLLLERITDTSLGELARREIFAPLNLKRTFFPADPAFRDEVAASETGNEYERRMTGSIEALSPDQGFNGWREQVIWGEVHDGNCWFLGGSAGHAGLFSTAAETLRMAFQFLPGTTELLSADTCALFRANLTPGMEEARSFGWQLASTENSTAGPALSMDSFGHLGFTGTSCWADPARDRIFILLTNRTHTCAPPFTNINGVRRSFHTLAAEALNSLEFEVRGAK